MTRIVALHGFLGHPNDWEPLRRAIQDLSPHTQFEAIDVSFKNGGKLPKSMSAWAKKFNQAQKSHHVERNILLGYSMGGRLAFQAALDKPGLWDEVILVSSHPGLMDPSEKAQRLKADTDWAMKFKDLPWQEVVRLWNGQPVFIGSHEPPRQETDYDRSALSQVLVNWSLANQDFLPDAMRALKPKLHWYAGDKDTKYVSLFRNLRDQGFVEDFHAVTGSGHRIIFDKPRELARQLVHDLNL